MSDYLFKQRFFNGEEVYLLAKDCAEALGYESVDTFVEDYKTDLQLIDGIGYMMPETTFNHIVMSQNSHKTLSELGYIEVTKIQTLRSAIDSIKTSYGFSYAFGCEKQIYGSKAKKAGFENVEEYLAKYDMPHSIQRALTGIKNSRSEIESYKEDISKLKDKNVIDLEIMKANGLELQVATVFTPDGYIDARAFVTGYGIFYQVRIPNEYDDDSWDEDYTGVFVLDGNLCIYNPTEEEDVCHTYKECGKTPQNRDFREFSVLENIAWVAQNAKYDGEDYKMPGVRMHMENQIVLQLFTQNPSLPGTLIEGEINFDEASFITDTRLKPQG